MKTLLTFLLLCSISFIYSQESREPHRAEQIIQNYHQAVKNKSISDWQKLFSKDAKIFGTGPEETYSIQQFAEMVNNTFSMPDLIISNDNIKSEIIDLNPQLKMVIESSTFSIISSILPTRTIYVLRKEADWKICLINYNLATNNEELAQINKLFAEE